MIDILIQNVTLIDSTKKKSFIGGVVIVDSRIIEVYPGEPTIPLERFQKVIDGKGKYLLPGFFDVHSRGDLAIVSDPTRVCTISQGIATEVIGQDGFSVAPVSQKNYGLHSEYVSPMLGNPQLKWRWETVLEYLESLHSKTSTNLLFYSPHGTMRLEATLNPVLLRYLFERSIDEGAIGLSISTSKNPSSDGWNDDEELNPLLQILKKHDGVLNVNLENSEDVVKDVERAVTLARDFDLRLHLSRCCSGIDTILPVLDKLDKRKKDLQNLMVDMSPYSSRFFKLVDLLPEWAKTDTAEELRIKLKAELDLNKQNFENMRLVSASKEDLKKYEGSFLKTVALERDGSLYDLILYFILFDLEKALFECEVVEKSVLKKAFAFPFVVPATTGYFSGHLVPDIFGTVPRYVNSFSKEDVYSLNNKMSVFPANFYKIKWGIRRGLKANLILLNLNKFKTKADYVTPRCLTEGVDYVVINGGITLSEGKITGTRAGQVLSWI